MARGNARQTLFHTEDDYQRMLTGLEKTVLRTGWEVFSFVWMPNQIHLVFRTPKQIGLIGWLMIACFVRGKVVRWGAVPIPRGLALPPLRGGRDRRSASQSAGGSLRGMGVG